MLADLQSIQSLLRQPGETQRKVSLRWEGSDLRAATVAGFDDGEPPFPIIRGQPVLVDFSRSIMSPEWFKDDRGDHSPIGKRRRLLRTLKGRLIGTAHISRRNLNRFRSLIMQRAEQRQPRVLMIGAATKGMGTEDLYADTNISQIAFDIYPSQLTTFVADAHQIPLEDESVDAVCIQAVLEHVLDPPVVVGEIHRVLKSGGLVYAETPFMQQVHEGAYDFTRYTELGHRWLFRNFDAMDRGSIGGPGLSLYWGSRHFLRALTRSKTAGDILSLPAAMFALLDKVVPPKHMTDGANGVFFLGCKASAAADPGSIAGEYLGAQG